MNIFVIFAGSDCPFSRVSADVKQVLWLFCVNDWQGFRESNIRIEVVEFKPGFLFPLGQSRESFVNRSPFVAEDFETLRLSVFD